MKKLLVLALIGFGISTCSYASEKICFGMGDKKGDRFVINVSADKVVFSECKGSMEDFLHGTYKNSGTVKGKDGKTYLEFYLGNFDDAYYLLVDKVLLKKGTKAYAKVRGRGEGFEQDTFFCKDSN